MSFWIALQWGGSLSDSPGVEPQASIPIAQARTGTTERRSESRQATRGHAIATITTDDGDVRLARAELIDASIRGLGVRLNQAAPTGSRIKLYFNGEVTPGRTGYVSRCRESGQAWDVGVACDLSLAA